MKKLAIAFIVGLIVLSVIQASNSAEQTPKQIVRNGDDAPWPTFHGDLARTGNTTEWGPGTNKMLWSNGTGRNCYSSPAVAGGRVFIGSGDNALYCFNATTGARLWRTATQNWVFSSPAVDVSADMVYVGSMDHYIYCFNATSGAQVWRNQTGGDLSSSPLLYGGNVYIGCGDWYWGPADGYLYCFNATSGELVWKTAGAGGAASPAVADGQLFSVSNNNMHCLDPQTGAFKWNASIGASYYGSPAVSDGRVFCSAGNGHLYCFDASNGSLCWEKVSGFGESQSTPAVSNGSVYACFDGGDLTPGCLKKYDAMDGTLLWTYNTQGTPWGGPTVTGNRVYFSNDRTVLCLNTADATLVWSYLGAAGDTYGIAGCPALAGGRLYIGGAESKIYCFGALEPNKAPFPVNLAPPHTIRETSVCLQWNQSLEPDFSSYEVHRSPVPSFAPGPATMVTNLTFRASCELNVTGLAYSTKYYFKVRVWDNGDPPMFNDSNEVDAVTATPNGAPAAVKLYAAEDVTPFSMRLSWSTNGDLDFAGYEVHRGLSKGFTPGVSTLVKSFDQRDQNSTLVESLKPWTTYYFRVRVFDNGSPPLRNDSNELAARTVNTPPAAVALNPVQMGATSASLSWSVSADDDFARYEVHFSRNASFTPDGTTLAQNQTARQITDHTIEGLQLARTYYFLVRTCDEGGLWNDSSIQSGMTQNTVPRPVISSPDDGNIYDTRTPVDFNASGSTDQDRDILSFYWTSSVSGFLSREEAFTAFLPEGSHRITLYVNDGAGHNVSAKVSVTVNRAPDRAPAIAVAFPLDNAELSGRVTLHGTASDPDGNDSLTMVELSIDKGAWQEADGQTSWSFEWNTSKVANGKHKIAFRAFDGELQSPEVTVSFKVNNVIINLRPTVAITGPSAAKPFSGTVTITGTASDPESNLTRVDMSLNGGGWSTVTGTSSWSYILDTTELSNGKHSIQVRAFDGVNFSDTAQLDFSVNNAAAMTASRPSNMLLYGAIAAVMVVALVAAALFMRGRKAKGVAPQPVLAPPEAQPLIAQPYQPQTPVQPPAQQYQHQPPLQPPAGG